MIRIVVLAAIAGWWVLPQAAYATSSATNITISSLSPNPIVADGSSTATAIASVTDAGTPVPGDIVTFTNEIGSTTDNGDGTYTATIQSTTTAGQVPIIATDSSTLTPITSLPVTLNQIAGSAANVQLALSTSTIVANGSSNTTATATVTDANGNPVSGESVSFGVVSGTPVTFSSSSCFTNSSGTCNVRITGTTVGSTVIGASDGGLSSNQQGLTETPGPPSNVTLSLNPPTILGDGSSTTTATATVTDAQSHPLSGQSVTFGQSGAPVPFSSSSCGPTDSNGQCSITITSTVVRSTTTTTITATDGGVSSTPQTLTQSATPSTTSLVASSTSLVTNQPVTLLATVSSAGSVVGTITFEDGGAPIAGCTGEAVSASSTSATCVASFAAAGSPAQVTAVFTAGPGSTAPGSTSGGLSIAVGRDSSSVSVQVPASATTGQVLSYTAVVTPPSNRPGPTEPTGTVQFFDNGQPIPSCAGQPLVNSSATCTVTYKRVGPHTITARYGGDANFSASTSPAAPLAVVRAPIIGSLGETMQWTFYFTPSYTKVLLLVVQGASAGDTVLVTCHGHGCPFRKHVSKVMKRKHCSRRHGKRACSARRRTDLTVPLQGHRLQVGAKLTVSITRPNWIGKYYAFTMRAGHGPRIQISCLTPGYPKPGVGCPH